MHHKTRLSILLICIILLFSCKTAEETVEQPHEDIPEKQTVQLSQGAELQQDSESGPELQPPEVSEDSDTEAELELEWEDENVALKKIPPRGGMKFRPEALEPEESAALLETEPTKLTVPENVEIKVSVIELEPSIELTEEHIKTENTVDSPVQIFINEDLPSERDELPSNPLLPLVIKVEEDMLEADKEVINSPVSILEEPAAEISAVAEETIIPEPAAVVENIDMNEDEYSLSIDSSGKLIVHLQGAGWVFLSSSGNTELKLRDKSYEPASGRTRFAFTVKNSGEYDAEMIFMKQDLLKGESEQRVLSIDDDSLETEAAVSSEEIVEKTSLSDPASENTELESEEPVRDALLATSEDILEADSTEDTVEGEVPAESSENEIVLMPADLDKLNASELYDLARIYEKPGSQQSLETAMDLYIKIKNDFPVTEERFMAESRIRYLNKHYFKVQ
jgi:hypothetical protein